VDKKDRSVLPGVLLSPHYFFRHDAFVILVANAIEFLLLESGNGCYDYDYRVDGQLLLIVNHSKQSNLLILIILDYFIVLQDDVYKDVLE